jgi:thymidylate synthase ThyX
MVPLWYHFFMAMNLRLSEKQSKELRKVAEQRGISMQEAALQAIDEYLSHRAQRLSENIARIKKEDANLLDRLSK